MERNDCKSDLRYTGVMLDQLSCEATHWKLGQFVENVEFILAFFIREDALSVWTNLGKHSLFIWLYVSSIKTGTRRIIRLSCLDELSSVVRRSSRTIAGSSSRRIMRLVQSLY